MRKAIGILFDMLFDPKTRAIALRELNLILMPRVRWNLDEADYLTMQKLIGSDSDMWYCWSHEYCMGIASESEFYLSGQPLSMVTLCGASGKPFIGNAIPRTLLVDVPWTEYIISRYASS